MANLKDTTVHGELRVTRGFKLLGPLVRKFKDPRHGSGNPIEYVKVVDTNRNIGSNSSVDYNLSTLLGDVSKFNLRGVRIEVMALDEDAGSPTKGNYVNSEAMITRGISGNVVKLHNYSNATAKCQIFIAVPVSV